MQKKSGTVVITNDVVISKGGKTPVVRQNQIAGPG
jgi:hypothetical protein